MSRNRYPIILAHGIARFDILRRLTLEQIGRFWPEYNFETDKLHYFRGIRNYLRDKHKLEAHTTSVNFAGNTDLRARQLSEEIQTILNKGNHSKVHIIGHSMGGLDARHMIVHDYNGMAEKVASLTTIGTPHLGTSVAEYVKQYGSDQAIDMIEKMFDWDFDGFKELTPSVCQQFNREAEHQEATNNVVYQTYASSQSKKLIFAPLQISWQIIKDEEGGDSYKGQNDGLVSVNSQYWKRILHGNNGETKKIQHYAFPSADHMNQIGWWDINELGNLHWWNLRASWGKWRYERKIKRVYFDIAQSVHNL